MQARLQQFVSGVAAFFMAQPPARRVALVAVGLTSMVVVLGLAWWVQRPLYRPLFTKLDQDDAAAIVEALRAEKVLFQLADGVGKARQRASRLLGELVEQSSGGKPDCHLGGAMGLRADCGLYP